MKMQTTIEDLLDVIHLAIIKKHPSKSNEIILDELKSISAKIESGQLENYTLDDTPFFKTIINAYKNEKD